MDNYNKLLNEYSISIPIDSYLSVREDNIYINNKTTETYNGRPLWNKRSALIYFSTVRLLFYKEFKISVSEIHILQASNLTGGFPIPDKDGHYSWVRIKTSDNRYSQWVVTDFYPSKTYCSCNSATDSVNLTRANSAFRKGLIDSLSPINPLIVNKEIN